MYSHPSAIVGGIEAAADVAFVRALARILPVGIVEVREVRQVRHIGHEALDPSLECLPDVRSALREALVDLAGDRHQHADQVCHVAARIVDVGLQQDGVSRRLVELDVVAFRKKTFELRAVEAGGPAHDELDEAAAATNLATVAAAKSATDRAVQPYATCRGEWSASHSCSLFSPRLASWSPAFRPSVCSPSPLFS